MLGIIRAPAGRPWRIILDDSRRSSRDPSARRVRRTACWCASSATAPGTAAPSAPCTRAAKSSLRPLEDVLADVDAMAAAAEVLQARGRRRRPRAAWCRRRPTRWRCSCGGGGRTVFLQDADPCAVKPEKLAAVIRRVRERFPTVERVTTYGRAARWRGARPSSSRCSSTPASRACTWASSRAPTRSSWRSTRAAPAAT